MMCDVGVDVWMKYCIGRGFLEYYIQDAILEEISNEDFSLSSLIIV